MLRLRPWLLAALMLALPGAARPAPARPQPQAITVFAAASLKGSLDAVAAAWSRESGQKVSLSYASSNALAQQIEKGAPADIFISADSQWMDYLAARSLIDAGTRFELARNRLVWIAPATSRVRAAQLKSPAQLLRALGDGRLAVAETRSVPAGHYARQSLQSAGLWDVVAMRLAPGDNVRAALAFVARGEAPLGIVYATDARAEPRVRVVAPITARSHARIAYPAAALTRGNVKASRGFLAFLRSPTARAEFGRAEIGRAHV